MSSELPFVLCAVPTAPTDSHVNCFNSERFRAMTERCLSQMAKSVMSLLAENKEVTVANVEDALQQSIVQTYNIKTNTEDITSHVKLPSAYNFFTKEYWKEYKEAHPDADFATASKLCSTQWHALSPQERLKYLQISSNLRSFVQVPTENGEDVIKRKKRSRAGKPLLASSAQS